MPEPTVTVRMKENVQDVCQYWRAALCAIALGVTCLNPKEIAVTHTRFAFIKARWHAEIVDRAYEGFTQLIQPTFVDSYDVPGAFEMPLMAQTLAESGRYDAIACAALVVDGGIYRHDFVAAAVVDGLMQVGLKTGVPVLSVSLTPHHFQETDHHMAIYGDHFVLKGREAAQAALGILDVRKSLRSAA